MRLDEAMTRLPDSLRWILEEHPLVADRLAEGRPLASAFDQVWARRWIVNASPVALELLRCLLRRFAAQPFTEAEAETAAGRELFPAWTGAEIRLALLRLRADGILFAARKSWGDRLLFLPSDRIALWHSALFADELVPLSEEEESRLEIRRGEGRLPLSWQMLQTWSDIRLRGFPLTTKGIPYKAQSRRLAADMSLTSAEVHPFFNQPPETESLLPAPLALAIELGLELGILNGTASSIEAGNGEGLSWFETSMEEVDSILHGVIVERYASAKPDLYFAALSLSSVEPFLWYADERLCPAFGLSERHPCRAAWNDWIQAATDLGWMEQGRIGGGRALRWRIHPSLPEGKKEPADYPVGTQEAIYVQSDLEIIVPPEVSFGTRWRLEETGERISLDTVSTYRLTRASCERAERLGYTLERIASTLEQASGEPVSATVRSALEDWLGGSRDSTGTASDSKSRKQEEGAPPFRRVLRPDPLEEYELDGYMPRREELFPGLSSVPAAWLTQSRSYHASTRKDMAEQALAWGTPLQIGPEGEESFLFLPERVERSEGGWAVVGRIRSQGGEIESSLGNEPIALSLDNLRELRLELPPPLA